MLTFLAETLQTTSRRFAALTRYSGSLRCLSSMLNALSRSSSELSGLLSSVSLLQILCCLAACENDLLKYVQCWEDSRNGAFVIKRAIAPRLCGVRKVLTSKHSKLGISFASTRRATFELSVSSTDDLIQPQSLRSSRRKKREKATMKPYISPSPCPTCRFPNQESTLSLTLCAFCSLTDVSHLRAFSNDDSKRKTVYTASVQFQKTMYE